MANRPPSSKVCILKHSQFLRLSQILHELNNASTGLLLSVGLLADALPTGEMRLSCQQIQQSAERCAGLLREARRLLPQAQAATGK